MREFTVDRGTVVRAAEAAIGEARRTGSQVPTPLVKRLMRVARTAPAFAIGAWSLKECGCLIGNLHGGDVIPGRLPVPEYRIGMTFNDALIDRLPAEAALMWAAIVRVTA